MAASRPVPGHASDAADPRPDILVVQSIRTGRTGDFAVLYRRYRDWVHRVAWRFTGDADAAAEAVRDVFSRLRARLETLELHARLTTVLYPMIREACRGTRADRGAPAEPRLWSTGGGDADRGLLAAVNSLPDGERAALLLRIVDGLGVTPAAAALNLTEPELKVRVQGALAALRDRALRAPAG